jgi:hypothetical protein
MLRREPEASGGPRTTVGLWLRAGWRGDHEDHQRLVRQLNRGEKGWNADEPAVVEAACQLAVRRFFGAYRDRDTGTLVSIAEFVRDMRERIGKQRTPPSQEDMEVVIRAALDDSVAVPAHIRRGELLNIRGAVAFNIVISIMELDAQALDRFIAEAEELAMARGYQPPLATGAGVTGRGMFR